jgi:hypothetical protein
MQASARRLAKPGAAHEIALLSIDQDGRREAQAM